MEEARGRGEGGGERRRRGATHDDVSANPL